jgi:hypothetical protein
MGLISITNPADGETIDASDVSTPFDTIKNEINGNLDTDNFTSAATNLSTVAEAVAWTSFTPTWSNVTHGSGGTNAGRYYTLGNLVFCTVSLILGTGGDVTGTLAMTLPNSHTTANQTAGYVGIAKALDSGTSHYVLAASLTANDTSVGFFYNNSSAVGQTVPFDWTASDTLTFSIVYEKA